MLQKWETACWALTFCLGSTLFGIYAVWGEHWIFKLRRIWYECEGIPCHSPVSNKLTLVYAIQLAYYIQAIPTLFIWDTKRSDFYAMLVHHCFTIGLISYSIGCNFFRFGVVILLLHDVCDVFLESAKLFKLSNPILFHLTCFRSYLEYKNSTDITFGVFLLTWIAMRLVYLPMFVMPSCMVDPLLYLAAPYNVNPEPHYFFLNGLLVLLYCIHIYWTYPIVKIAYSAIVLGIDVEDVREDENDEEPKRSANQKSDGKDNSQGVKPVRPNPLANGDDHQVPKPDETNPSKNEVSTDHNNGRNPKPEETNSLENEEPFAKDDNHHDRKLVEPTNSAER